jgi:oxygen-independent coproporphyrinogen III oxidase
MIDAVAFQPGLQMPPAEFRVAHADALSGPPRRLTSAPAAGIYLHWPFCLSKCAYCDFVSTVNAPAKSEPYARALIQEVRSFPQGTSDEWRMIDTLYWGGGTPSLMPLEQLADIMGACREHFDLLQDLEVTLEVNPGTMDLEKARGFHRVGVNRISLGVESFHDEELALLGRRHGVSQAVEAYRYCREAGFDNISVDLICGLPYQTARQWRESLNRLVELAPEHVSIYLLELHQGTRLNTEVQSGRLTLPSDEETISRYYECIDAMAQAGYEHYEISNFARDGRYSRHNLKYWSDQPYLAFGAGAHSYYGGVRFANEPRIPDYIQKVIRTGSGMKERTDLAFARWLGDYAMTALRLRRGIDLETFRNTYGFCFQDCFSEQIARLMEWGLLEHQAGCLRLTCKALPVSNTVFLEFI